MKWLVCCGVVMAMSAAPAAQVSGPEAPSAVQPGTTQQAPPVHVHTGWSTLLKDSANDFVTFPKRKSTWTLLGIGAAAALAARPADGHVERHIVGNETADRVFGLGQWIGNTYVQIGSAVGLWAVGRYVAAPAANEPETNRISEIGFDLVRAQILSHGLVHAMKRSGRRDRPTGECCAFPSGHAAAAFAAASVLERHLGYRGSWPALVGATYVAASRLVDNRHFLSDVMFGAALGTASGWTVVGRQGSNQYSLQPVPVRGGMMIALTRTERAGAN